jgi:phytoene dehydrogenase-like protein
MFSQWVPHEWASEPPPRGELEAYADRIIDGYADVAPNFKASVIDRQIIGSFEMERDLGLIGGNIFHGEMGIDQLFHMRPSPGFADYRTPVPGLYHGSAATHAGGGVNGIPGWQAFRAARADRRAKYRYT